VRTFTQLLERLIRTFRAGVLVPRSLRSDNTGVTDTLSRLTEQQEDEQQEDALAGTLCTACGKQITDSSDAHLIVLVERMPPVDAAVLCGRCAGDLLELVLHAKN
jgi:hypothetical protein